MATPLAVVVGGATFAKAASVILLNLGMSKVSVRRSRRRRRFRFRERKGDNDRKVIRRKGRRDLPVRSKSKMRRSEREIRRGGRLISSRSKPSRRDVVKNNKRTVGDV